MPLTDISASVPVKLALEGTDMLSVTSLAPVPVKVGADAVYAASPVFTVTLDVVMDAPVVYPS